DLVHAPPDDITLVDDIARLLLLADDGDLAAERELLRRYREDDRLHPSTHVQSTSPNGGLYGIDLAARATTRIE
ncbi:MAG: hypothetical protein QOI47_1773, partial [Actinomycetota bacterium]|nr:hypothetical protein [Actinomycetota bacterium]